MMYKLVVFVPVNHKEKVKEALFEAGAGRYADYDCCSWETMGVGQFRPLDGSDPFIGKNGVVEQVEEYRIEMICEEAVIESAVEALIIAHPYEEPAFEYWSVNVKQKGSLV